MVIAGREAIGKTALATNIALNATVKSGIPVLLFSFEMAGHSLAERMLCAEARVDSVRLRHGFLETAHWVKITKAASSLVELPIHIYDWNTSVLDIREIVRRWRADVTVFGAGVTTGLVLVDSIDSFRGDDTHADRVLALKRLAEECNCQVIVTAPLKPSGKTRADKRPLSSDLYARSALENYANSIILLYRDEVYSKDRCRPEDRGVAELIIARGWHRGTGTIRLKFIPQEVRFEELPP